MNAAEQSMEKLTEEYADRFQGIGQNARTNKTTQQGSEAYIHQKTRHVPFHVWAEVKKELVGLE